MRASALEKLKLERKVCQEDNLTYSSSPKKKVELDAKIEENKIEEEEISQDDLKSLLMPDLKGIYSCLTLRSVFFNPGICESIFSKLGRDIRKRTLASRSH